mmetsp:Transcript_28048/g.84060  ORF Transcript_28048/g.84060 Transcript_28048/m.84060 type:complete len:233 (-) Transcript_28048:37-735(-)
MVAWTQLGRHERYGNGLERPKLRGWVYPIVALIGTALLWRFPLEPERSSLARATLAVYAMGSVLHLVPFESARGYCLALACDFGTITFVYTKHIGVYCGGGWALALSLVFSLVLVASHAYSLFHGRDIQFAKSDRKLRQFLGLAQTLLLAFVELLTLESMRKRIVVSKIGAFLYFYLGGRLDAPAKFRFLTKDGYWGVHDNFHLMVLGVHCMQVYGVAFRRSPSLGSFCPAQ